MSSASFRARSLIFILLAGIFLADCSFLGASEAAWHQTDFTPADFAARWAAVYDAIGNDAVAIVPGGTQTNEFYYLCGIETPGSYVLLDARSRKATLFLPPHNARLEAAEGKVLSAED